MSDDADWMRPPFDPIALAEGSVWPWKGTPEQSYEVSYVPVERPAGVKSETVGGVTINYGPPPPPRGENPGKSTRGHLTSTFKEATKAQRAAEAAEALERWRADHERATTPPWVRIDRFTE